MATVVRVVNVAIITVVVVMTVRGRKQWEGRK